MRKLVCLAGLLLLVSVSASAQDSSKVDVFGGYSYFRFSPNIPSSGISPINFNGGIGSVSFNPTDWVGLVGEIGVYHAGNIKANGVTVPNITVNSVSYLFGPKIFKSMGKITPFAQTLFGGAHASPSGSAAASSVSENGLAIALGGGLDWNATHHIAVRLAQAEYVMTRFSGTTPNGFENGGTGMQNNFRYSAGVVFRF